MFNFLSKFKLRKKTNQGTIIVNPLYEKPEFDIFIEETNQYTKLTITNYIRIQDYGIRLKEKDINPKNPIKYEYFME